MRDGVIQQLDRPATVYESPSNRFVGSFIGNPPMNFLEAGIKRRAATGEPLTVQVGDLRITPPDAVLPSLIEFSGDRITLGIRAENMEAVSGPQSDAVAVDVEVVEPLGSQNLLTVTLAGHKLKVSTHPTFPAEVNERLWIRFPRDHIRWINPSNEEVLYG